MAPARDLFARLLLAACVLIGMAGCAGLPQQVERAPSHAVAAPAGTPLADVAPKAGVPANRSGFWPMLQAGFALDARLTLIRNARTSLDLQYYLIGNDTIGRLILRELRDAAARGVRVRLLVDDLYTEHMDELLLGLAAYPNVQVRLFNPFVSGRSFALGRFANFVGDFRRLNHRMHNKLFIADGAMAVAGGRNLADEYFLRSKDANFLDLDLLITGALVPQLETLFDTYWNSDEVYPVGSIAASALSAPALRDAFEDETAGPTDPATLPPEEPDVFGQPSFSRALAAGQFHFVVADAGAHADAPAKALPSNDGSTVTDTVTHHFNAFLHEAHSEVLLFSPYFIPGKRGIERLREARKAGVEVRIVTNAMGTSDEPLVNQGYGRYRRELLGMGVQLYEISASRLKRDPTLKRALGSSRGRLHAKLGIIDRSLVLVGSMNMDPRSSYINTEIGIGIRSPELAQMIVRGFRVDNFTGVYEVKLNADGSDVQWVGHDEHGEEVLTEDPDVSLWDKLRLWLLFLFVPEDLL